MGGEAGTGWGRGNCGQDVKYINLFKTKKGWVVTHDYNSSIKEAETGESLELTGSSS